PLPPFDAASAAREPRLGDPFDPGRPLAARARAYLHANCGHCHRENGGGTVPLQLNAAAKPDQMQAVSVPPVRRGLGLPGACAIKPGEPAASPLYFRMAKFGRDRMPHLGSEWPDEAALGLVANWIAGMNRGSAATPALNGGPPDQWLAAPGSALSAARKVGRGELAPADRDRLLAAAAKLPVGPTRDLFEGYLPRPPAGMRKLGPNPRPATILALKGEAGRGEGLFWSEAVKCGTCHKVGARGASVGPDRSTIGRDRSRADLLESILEPSRRIEPRYATYLARTADGRLVTGLLVARDERRVVLRDAQGKDTTLAAGEVEELRPSQVSLMPEGALASL